MHLLQPKSRLFLVLNFVLFLSATIVAQKTTVRGQVTDAKSKEPISYANVQFDGTNIGATADIDGNYYFETTEAVSKVKSTSVGYKTQIIPIQPNQANTVNIQLVEGSNDLTEVVVKVKKYRNKGNPAVELINNVIAHKSKNRKESFDYFSYKKYEKIQFSLNNITDKFNKNFMMRKMPFLRDNMDTNKASGKVNLPFFLRETISDNYYRRSPKSQKEYIRGEKNTNLSGYLDNDGISQHLENLYQDVDIYDNAINLLTLQFVSPIAPIAPNIYRFYIVDTVMIKKTPCVHLYFAPRNKGDKAFIGNIWIALDSSYAMRKVDVGIPSDINMNWINELQISQEFDWIDSPEVEGGTPQYDTVSIIKKRGLMLSKDEIFMDFGFSKSDSSRSVLGKKTTLYEKYTINQPLPSKLFSPIPKTIRDDNSGTQTADYWTQNRLDTLTKIEIGIVKTVDSLNNFKPFRRVMDLLRVLTSGYVTTGWVEFGPIGALISYNPVEGLRTRFGGKTTEKFSKHLQIDGYVAYGNNDKLWKYNANLRYSFGKEGYLKLPLNQVRLWYQYDAKIPGHDQQFVIEDALLLSLRRGINDKMFLNRTMGMELIHKNNAGLTYTFSAKQINIAPHGVLRFDFSDSDGTPRQRKAIDATELGFAIRYAPNEQVFVKASGKRKRILNKFPIFNVSYDQGIKGLGNGEYDYQTVRFKADKVFYLSPIGRGQGVLELGKTWGRIPYPLLAAHRANQTYAYLLESYNLMNFFEFMSDKYVSVTYFHNFGGFFFNRVPLLKKLDLREVITFKTLYGTIGDRNRPQKGNGLFDFPKDENGNTLTKSLEKQPYFEASVGISNIFKLIRIDYVRRLSYLDYNGKGTQNWGIRANAKLEF
jgi:Family of unknown function (DUF5686)/CarboxypepD_reg-like domain